MGFFDGSLMSFLVFTLWVTFVPFTIGFLWALKRTNAKQQTQIDTLTRELEEVKRKLEK